MATKSTKTQKPVSRAKYTREYRKEHPDKMQEWRINAAIALLQRNGYQIFRQTKIDGTLVTMEYAAGKTVVRADRLPGTVKDGEADER